MNTIYKNSKKSYLKYLTALLLFGTNGIVASRISLDSCSIVFLRTLLGSIFLLFIFVLTGHRFTFQKRRKDFVYIVVSGIAMGASWMCLYEAYRRIGVSIASLLYYCGPVIVMALSPVLFNERLTRYKIIGFAAVICGIVCVNGSMEKELNIFGIICGCGSALFYSVMVSANKKARHIEGFENSLIQIVISFLTATVFAGIKTSYVFNIQHTDLLWIFILGILNTGIGCYFYFSSIGRLPVQTVAVCGYLEPLSAVLFSVVLLNETMSPLQTAGAVLIIGGAIFSEVKGNKKSALKEIYDTREENTNNEGTLFQRN